jgi:excisionase family DNA binding protein
LQAVHGERSRPFSPVLSVARAASLLNVSEQTIRRWIETDKIPFLRLPSGAYRIPQGGLLASLEGTYDLADAIGALDEQLADVSQDDVRRAIDPQG